jgi:hypothetical protein
VSTNTPIASQTLSSAAASVTLSNIPQTYTDLVLVCAVKNTANNGDEVAFQLNSDTGSNYSRTRIFGNGSTASSGRASNTTKGALGINSTAEFSTVMANFQNYSNATTYKTVVSRGSDASNYVSSYVSLWRNTNAITSIVLLPDSGTTFTSGSTFNLYGIDASLSAQAKAYGGSSIYTDGTYWYHIFNQSGTFTPTEALTADYLVVAGGGGGGGGFYGGGGGGGAGGYRNFTAQLLDSGTNYSVTVGAGGAGNPTTSGVKGNNSSFSSTSSTGGGRGGYIGSGADGPGTGGSGGGGGGNASAAGASGNEGGYSPSEGNSGGAANGSGASAAGGGAGGSGGNGATGTSGNGGNGGSGTASSITGSSVTYAGGGGGGSFSFTGGTGAGGGGNGGSGLNVGTAGNVNTGGGGGGGGQDRTGGAGGSGIVIVRYAV